VTSRPARKRFGQNFLHDTHIIGRIVAAVAPQPDEHLVEIGPGHGALTQPLSPLCGKLDVIEIDRDLADDLEKQDWANQITVHRADALRFNFAKLADPVNTDDPQRSMRLTGNLPYNISTPLLFHILDHYHLFSDIHVMLQREVVQRMAADPGSRTYGRLSVALAARCQVESLFVIKPGAFQPAPKVQSAFARLTPLATPLVKPAEWPVFDEILRCAFGQRRKQLGNALRPLMEPGAIAAAGVDPKQRAEQLAVHDFVSLTQIALSRTS